MTIAEKITRAKADYDAVYEGGKAKAISEVEPLNAELEQILYGKDTGGRGFYGEFWSAYLNEGKRGNFRLAFYGEGWTKKTFRPTYDIRVTSDAENMFQNFNANTSAFDLYEHLQMLGVSIDFSGATILGYAFYSMNVSRLPAISTVSCQTLTQLFGYSSVETIDKVILKEDGSQTFSGAFQGCSLLKNLTIEGTIGQNGFDAHWSVNLSKASITSIINALSATTSGLAVTLSKTAVNKAFETAEGANDGSTSAEWNTLIAPKSNWTISLV